MARKLFLNLPVKDLDASVTFFTKLGFTFDENMTDETATAMIVNEHTWVMLLTESFFSGFTKKALVDTTTHTEAITCVSAESRQEVDDFVDSAVAAGAGPSNDPMDEGFMYCRSFADLDGHLWEVMHMDLSALPQQ